MTMRVLHVVGGYPSPKRPDFQAFIQIQVDSLRSLGLACEVMVLSGPGPLKYLGGWPQVHRRMKDAEFDLIHAHYAYCAVPSFGHGCPVVTSFQGSDLLGLPRPDGSFPSSTRALHRRLCRYVARRSAASIVKAAWMREVVGPDAHVVPNGVDLTRFRPVEPDRRSALRRELGLDEKARYVLFCANPARPNKRFALAEAAVSRAAERLDAPIRLIAVHGRTHEEVARFMAACDLLILTSTHEGSPNVVKEAMACGMRIVSLDVGDVRERLQGVSGCRVTADAAPESIGAAIVEALISNEPAGGREAVAPLELGLIAGRICAIYAGVLQERTPKDRGR